MSKLTLLFTIIMAMVCSGLWGQGHALNGMTGLYSIPSAYVGKDGQATFGAIYNNKKYLDYSEEKYAAAAAYGCVTFLPGVELGIRITRMLGMSSHSYDDGQGSGHSSDRVPSLKIRLLKESEMLPAFAVGMHDMFSSLSDSATVHFNTVYTVASKNFELPWQGAIASLTAGYSFDVMDAEGYEYNGLFGGVNVSYKRFELLLEHDSYRFNVGSRVNIYKGLGALVGLKGAQAFYGSLFYSFNMFGN